MARPEEEINTRFTSKKTRLATRILCTGNWIKSGFSDFIKPFGISNQQFNVLRILRGSKDWLSMNDIKDRMLEKAPNATRLCDKLINKNLVMRQRSKEDRRIVYLKISNLGLGLLADIDDKDGKSHKNFLDNVTDEEARIVSDLLDKLRE